VRQNDIAMFEPGKVEFPITDAAEGQFI